MLDEVGSLTDEPAISFSAAAIRRHFEGDLEIEPALCGISDEDIEDASVTQRVTAEGPVAVSTNDLSGPCADKEGRLGERKCFERTRRSVDSKAVTTREELADS